MSSLLRRDHPVWKHCQHYQLFTFSQGDENFALYKVVCYYQPPPLLLRPYSPFDQSISCKIVPSHEHLVSGAVLPNFHSPQHGTRSSHRSVSGHETSLAGVDAPEKKLVFHAPQSCAMQAALRRNCLTTHTQVAGVSCE